jgi:photosynthetic reaction center cytochrome c subunit
MPQYVFSRSSVRFLVTSGAISVVWLASVASAGGQARRAEPTAQEQKVQMAEDVFTNVQLLKGIPVKEFMGTMGFFSAATGMNCTQCHVEESGGSWARYADETPLKRTARRMIVMMNAINQTYFAGRRVVTCYSCHRGGTRPEVIPDLAVQYGEPVIREPDEIFRQAPGVPSADQVLDKYIQAIGGAQRVANLTSFVARGNHKGYDDYEKYPAEVYAKAPGQRTTIVHGDNGDSTATYNGRSGWTAAPDTTTPVAVLPLTGDDLAGAKVEAELSFPAQIKQALSDWRVGPPTTIDDRDVLVVQGRTGAGRPPIKLYFDADSGLLVRLLRYTDTPVGRIPTQIDYADYRDVSGIKMPFKWTTTWTDGRSVTELNSVQINAPVDAAIFAQPTRPAPPPARK